MITVSENAYLTRAREIKNFSMIHEKLLLALIHEKKYYTKEELLCFTKQNPRILDNILEELEKAKLINVEGWLVKIKETEKFNLELCEIEILKN